MAAIVDSVCVTLTQPGKRDEPNCNSNGIDDANEEAVSGNELSSSGKHSKPAEMSAHAPLIPLWDTNETSNDSTLTTVSNKLESDTTNSNGFDETSLSSVEPDENDAMAVPKELLEEERKLALQTESEMKKQAENAPEIDLEEKQKRYKTLMALLGKSNQYATYMSKKLIDDQAETCKKNSTVENESPKVLQNATNKRKSSSKDGNATKKAKIEKNSLEFNPETHYKNRMGLVVSRRQPETLVGGIMRDYQLDGLEWLVALYKNAVNGILADEMGLGKTIQLIGLLCHLREKKIYGPHLIIAPLSTLPNWLLEFANFAPDVPVVLFHGTEEKRISVRDRFIEAMQNDKSQIPVVITSFEMPLRDKRFLSAVNWCYTIVDEGHRLKNYSSMLSMELRRYKTESRLLLTGTPLQNNITELWSLLNYLIPEIFDNLPLFENLFDFSDLNDADKHDELIRKEKEEQIISKMHRILEPFLLRRIKADVSIALPRKKEVLVYAPLTAEQKELYKATIEKSISMMADAENEATNDVIVAGKRKRKCTQNVSYNEDWNISEEMDYIPITRALQSAKQRRRIRQGEYEYVFNIKLQNPVMMLRKIVNHPYLVKTPVFPGTRDIVVDDKLIEQSGKLLVLDALLPRLKADGHKVLLFSTFKVLLDLIEDYAIMRKYTYVRLDGSTLIENRLENIKKFNGDPNTFMFLISTRAGGLGINLTAADTVIIYDSDWNPQVDLQAQDRCHRIGQTRPVIVYRLITSGTVDERIVQCATSKRRLEKLVVKQGKFKQEPNREQISVDELQELLKSIDHDHVVHPNGLVLSDKEIEMLLDRSDLLKESNEENKSKKSQIIT